MTSLVKRLAQDAAEPFERLGAQFFKKAALFISGFSCLMVSLVFFTFALTHYLLAIAGTEIAARSVGGLYLAFALILLLLGGSGTRRRPESGTPVALPAKAAAETTVATQSKDSSNFSRQLDGIVVPIHDALREAGLERERATLMAGAAIAKELTPLASVAFAFVTGIMLGRLWRSHSSQA
jgi:hypothetical protein